MRKIFHTLLLSLLTLSMISCGSPDEDAYQGYLYFSQGSYLMSFSLRNGEISVVTNLGNKNIQNISHLGDGKLLISELALINRKEISRISWMDLKTGRSNVLYSGVQARYLADAGVIVYDDGSNLYSVSMGEGSEIDSIILSHKRHQLSAMVEVSGTRLLLEILQEGQPVIHDYQAETGELRTLEKLSGLCKLEGAVWIGDLEQLACRIQGDEATGRYVLADLDGNLVSSLFLPEGEKFLALAYIADQGVLILQERWQGGFGGQMKSAVWAHDIQSGKNQRLSKTQNLGESAVYTKY